MVTAAQVWDALDEIPDPEIPSSRSSTWASSARSMSPMDTSRGVHADVPRLPGARGDERAIEETVRRSAPSPTSRSIQDDSWSTDKITPAGREKLRAAGFARRRRARPARRARAASGERAPLPVLRLERHDAREHLRPDAVPVAPLLHELPPAVRAVQDDLTETGGQWFAAGRPGQRTFPRRGARSSCYVKSPIPGVREWRI